MIPRILMSYYYLQGRELESRIDKAFPTRPEMFADSGAFTAFMKHETISIDAYTAWLHKHKHLFEIYANLDVIGDEDATRRNQEILESNGLTPLPVFHITADMKYLDALLERYSYIAIGGLVPYLSRKAKCMPKLIQCFKRAKGRAVFHGFGVTNWYVMRVLPWFSVDSTSWIAGARFGKPYLFDPETVDIVEARVGKNITYQYAPLIRSYGFDPQDFIDRSRYHRGFSAAISALSFLRAEQWIRDVQGYIHRPDDPAKVGLKLYLADADFRAYAYVNEHLRSRP